MTMKQRNYPARRVVELAECRELRTYAQSTSEQSDSQRTFPCDSRSSETASDSEHDRVPYTTLRRWPKDVLQRAARAFRSETVIDFQKLMRSMAHYHHAVIEKQSPSGDFTRRCRSVDNSGMENPMAPIRRRNLQRLIDRDFGGIQSAIARAYSPENPTPSYFSDLLRGKKSFAEVAAFNIEERIGLKVGQLSIPDSPLLYDDSRKNSLKDEIQVALEDLSKEEQREALAAIRKIQSKRAGRRKTGTQG